MVDEPRNATCAAASDNVEVFALGKADFKQALEGSASFKNQLAEFARLFQAVRIAVNESLTFSDLKKLLKTTDGNVSVHARKLEDAEYIACIKSFEGRVPKTEYRLTAAGRRALERYLNHMEALIHATRER
jgi:DNA-binding MarR family transcriptional regulator